MKNPRKIRSGHYLWIIIFILGGLTGTAWAEEPGDAFDAPEDVDERIAGDEMNEADARDAADAHYRMAVELYGQGRYRESVEEFDRVLELHDDPVVHCNRAIPLLELGRMRDAKLSLQACRDGYPSDSRDHQVANAEVDALTTTLEVVEPQARQIVEEINDRRDEAEEPTADASVAAQVPIPPRPVGPEVDGGSSTMQVAGLVLLGVGVGLGTAAGAVDYTSGDLVDEFRQQSLGGEGTSRQRHQELRGQLQMRQRIFWGLAASGAAAATLGLGFWTWGTLRKPSAPAEGVYLDIGGDGIQAGWRTTF